MGTSGSQTHTRAPLFLAAATTGTLGSSFGGFGAAPAPSSTTAAANPFGATTPGGLGAPSTAAAAPDSNVPVTAETSFAQLPQAMQQKVWEAHRLVMEHRKHAEAISRFSTQDYGLDQHTKVRLLCGVVIVCVCVEARAHMCVVHLSLSFGLTTWRVCASLPPVDDDDDDDDDNRS